VSELAQHTPVIYLIAAAGVIAWVIIQAFRLRNRQPNVDTDRVRTVGEILHEEIHALGKEPTLRMSRAGVYRSRRSDPDRTVQVNVKQPEPEQPWEWAK